MTLPTTPSGVMTPMSRATPSRAAAIDKRDAPAGAGAAADNARSQHGHFGVARAKIKQGGEAIGLGGAAFEFRIPQSQAIHLGAQLRVFAGHATHADVVVPAASDAAGQPSRGAAQRRHDLDGPYANQAHVLIALDLRGQQQDLYAQRSRQQKQRTM